MGRIIVVDVPAINNGVARTPSAHAPSHGKDGSDTLNMDELGAAAGSVGDVLTHDGAGGSSFLQPAAAGSLKTTGADVDVSGGAPPAAGQVLTASSATAAAFADAAASASIYDATVGSAPDADFSDISAAIADGKSSLLMLTDVTEDSDIVLASDLAIDLDRFQLTMAANQFTYSAVFHVRIHGRGADTGAEISWAQTVATQRLFSNSAHPTSITRISGCTLDNDSAVVVTPLSSGVDDIEHVRMELPDDRQGGFSGVAGSSYRNVQLVGGGPLCFDGMKYTGGSESIASDIHVTGQWSETLVGIDLEDGNAAHFIFDHITNAMQMDVDTTVLSNVINRSAQALNITIKPSGVCSLSNVHMNSGTLDIGGSWSRFSNVRSTGLLDLTDANADNHVFVNCKFDAAMVVAGDRNKFANCDFIGGVSVPSGADDNGFSNCQAGADAGGGAGTITISAGANRTRVLGCMTDAAISDSGAGSALAGNTVY